MRIKPLENRVVVQPIKADDRTAGGLYLPETARTGPLTGRVLAVGPGRTENGQRIPMTVKVGDTVILARYGGVEVDTGKGKVLVVQEHELIGIAEADEAARVPGPPDPPRPARPRPVA